MNVWQDGTSAKVELAREYLLQDIGLFTWTEDYKNQCAGKDNTWAYYYKRNAMA